MNEKIALERQTSRKYRAAYSYLNDSEHVGTARVLMRKPHRNRKPDSDGSGSTFMLLSISAPADQQEHVEDAIHDTMQHQCQCEHDCCGHVQTHIGRTRRLKSGLWAVVETFYRNI